jgi:pimeloyl-ACP methyl ester carboxylesterase
MGGAISLTLCLEAPHRVKGLVLVGSGAKLRVHPQILALTENDDLYQQATQLVTQWAFSASADSRLVELAQKRMGEVPAAVVHADFLACDNFDIMERLSEISVPTLVLCGVEDQMTPVKYSQYLHRHISHSQIVLIEGAGHMVMLEKPMEIARAIGGFLQNLN